MRQSARKSARHHYLANTGLLMLAQGTAHSSAVQASLNLLLHQLIRAQLAYLDQNTAREANVSWFLDAKNLSFSDSALNGIILKGNPMLTTWSLRWLWSTRRSSTIKLETAPKISLMGMWWSLIPPILTRPHLKLQHRFILKCRPYRSRILVAAGNRNARSVHKTYGKQSLFTHLILLFQRLIVDTKEDRLLRYRDWHVE